MTFKVKTKKPKEKKLPDVYQASIKSKKPSQKEFEEFYKDRFSRNYGLTCDKDYMNEWEGRFESPRKAWSYSDSETRKKLKKHFPETFKGIKIDDNLYDEKWGNKFVYW